MTHTYNVSGMACNGCMASVEKSLNAIQNFEDATVNLDKDKVTISTKTHSAIIRVIEALLDKNSVQFTRLNSTLILQITKTIFIKNPIVLIMVVLMLINLYQV